MFKWLGDLGLKKKLYLIFGIMVGAAVTGIIIGQITFARVQVGGTIYSNIVHNMQTAHDITVLKLNINLARGRTATMMAETEKEAKLGHMRAIKEQTEKIDDLFTRIEDDLIKDAIPGALASIKKARISWNAIKATRDDEVIPLLLEGQIARAKEIGGGVQSERFAVMTKATEDADAEVNSSVTRVVEKMKSESRLLRWGYIAGGIFFIFFIVIVEKFLSSTIIAPIVMVSGKSKSMAEGDFSRSHEMTQRKDEIGMMLRDFTIMSAKIGEMVGNIQSGMINLSSASEELSTTAEGLSRGAKEQSGQGDHVVRSVSEMSQTIMDVAKNTSQASDVTRESSGIAAAGKQTVEMAVDAMIKIAEDVKGATKTIEELGKSSQQIGEIVAVINDIAEQTNLLALNAAIEAARAGEQGRGFAIVADEVRKLAERTAKATRDITQRIATIQTEAESSVEVMMTGTKDVDNGVALAREASRSMDSIVDASSHLVEMVQKIAVSTDQQSTAAEEISSNMEGMSGLINRTADSTEHINQAARDLARLAVEIQGYMEWFKVGSSGKKTSGG